MEQQDTLYNDVNGWLTVGADLDLALMMLGQPYHKTIGQLSDHGVTHVLDVRIERNDRDLWVAAGLPAENYAHVPVVDQRGYSPPESWFCGVEESVRGFLSGREFGDRLYVHCQMGVNRGPSAAMLALLTYDKTMTPWGAFMEVREARPMAGIVYSVDVGSRHIVNEGVRKGINSNDVCNDVVDFRALTLAYWTKSMIQNARDSRPSLG